MLIVLLDEPGLFVFPSTEAAVLEIEPIDAESEIRAAFDESAVPYRVDWLRRNQRERRLFLRSITPGEYRLVPAGPADPAALVELLEGHLSYTDPPEAKPQLEALLARLRSA